MEAAIFVHPFHSPLGFLLDNINIFYGIEQIIFFILIFDISVNQKWVSLRMDVFHGDLESIETSGFRDLHLRTELTGKIFQDDAITGGKKCQHILDKVFFIGVEFLPIFQVLVEVDFISSPKWSKMFFIHLIDRMMMDGE